MILIYYLTKVYNNITFVKKNISMVSAYLMGGLGNMMFQIATADTLAKRNNDVSVFSTMGYYPHKSVLEYKDNIFSKVSFVNVLPSLSAYREQGFLYNEIPYEKDMILHGYFQSEKYIDKSDLFVNEEIYSSLKERYKEILPNSIGIHVRRGDYLNQQQYHPILPVEYYNNAIERITRDYKVNNILVFSDDIPWCKEQFGTGYYYIENNKDYEDLYLMSLCTHQVIANSSFSWWATFLSDTGMKIFPREWFGKDKQLNTSDLYIKNCIIL
jgi:hypothetical protein